MTANRSDDAKATADQAVEAPRVVAIDGLRGVAILLVLAHHFTQNVPAHTAVDRYFFALTNSTWLGVDLFFVLSGFLITGILHDARGATNYFRVFYARRILRILPIYYLLLAVLYLLLPPFGVQLKGLAADQPAWFWLHASNVATALYGWPDRAVAHLWSLAIEEHFYLIWPVLVWVTRRRVTLCVCLLMIAGAIASRVYLYSYGHGVSAIYVHTFSRVDALAIGAVLALALRDPLLRPWVARWLAPAGFVAAIAVGYVLYGPRGLDWPQWTLAQQAWSYSAIALVAMALLARTNADGWWSRVMSQAWLVWIGRLSYAMYLFHLPLECIARWLGWHPVHFAVAGESTWPMALLYIVGNTVVTIAVAWLSWHLVEAPILRHKRRFRYSSPQS